MRGATWTAERIALLKKLWAAGETAEAIGQRLGGFSRSAILGKVWRLRLDAVGSVATASKPAPTLKRRRTSPKDRQRPAPVKRSLPRGKTLLELTNEDCRWPHGRVGAPGFHFCAEPGADMSRDIPYCPHHMSRAYAGGSNLRAVSKRTPAETAPEASRSAHKRAA